MKHPHRWLRRVVGVSLVFGMLGLGCDLAAQLSAQTLAVATVIATPPLEIKAEALAGFDASVPANDSGITFDAGALLDAGITIPAQAVVNVFVGHMTGTSTDSAQPLIGATVTMAQQGGTTWPIPESGQGNYTLLGADAGFTYTSNATYNFTIVAAGQTYTASLENAPTAEHSPELHPALGYIDIAANTSFSFTRPVPDGQERNLGFVAVLPINTDGSRGDPTYTNIPKTPLEYVKVLVLAQDYKAALVTVPASAFPEKNKNYVIVLQALKSGKTTSNNLFAASAVLGGVADIGIVKTRP